MRAAVESRPAGEQSVTVADLHHIVFGAAHRHNGTGAAFFPQIHIVLGVVSDHAFAGRTGSGLDTHAVTKRHREHSVRIGLPQIAFGKKGKFVQILNSFDILGFYPFFVHQIPVIRNMIVDVPHLFDQFFRLQRFQLLERHGFDFFLIILTHFDHFLYFR